jgi:hypothetical protein
MKLEQIYVQAKHYKLLDWHIFSIQSHMNKICYRILGQSLLGVKIKVFKCPIDMVLFEETAEWGSNSVQHSFTFPRRTIMSICSVTSFLWDALEGRYGRDLNRFAQVPDHRERQNQNLVKCGVCSKRAGFHFGALFHHPKTVTNEELFQHRSL